MRARLADSIEVVSRANEERSIDGRGRGEGGFVEEIGGEDGEFAAGFQHGGGAGFGEEIESTVGGEGRGGVAGGISATGATGLAAGAARALALLAAALAFDAFAGETDMALTGCTGAAAESGRDGAAEDEALADA